MAVRGTTVCSARRSSPFPFLHAFVASGDLSGCPDRWWCFMNALGSKMDRLGFNPKQWLPRRREEKQEQPPVVMRTPGVLHVPNFDPNAKKQRLLGGMENPFIRGAVNGLLGGAMGGAFGLFMGSMYETGLPHEYYSKLSAKEQIRATLRGMRGKCVSYAKNFGIVGGIYTVFECLVEKQRGKHDLVNGTAAGCVTGAVLAASGGPGAACMGCMGFAAFSAAIEYYMNRG